MYNEIKNALGSNKEIITTSFSQLFLNSKECKKYGEYVYNNNKNAILEKRKENERHYYNYLEHQLFYRIQELKFNCGINISDSRKIIAVSTDCISTIHIIVRDKIHLNVYIRSSDFNGALPADLEFLLSLPNKLIAHLDFFKNDEKYSEVTEKLLYKLSDTMIELSITFGSLHISDRGLKQ